MSESISMTPIGTFRCSEVYPQEAARQGTVRPDSTGVVELNPGQNFEQAVLDLDGFSRIWLIFAFDRNSHWKPLAKPPRGDRKVGVFACRSPYRPNGIGLSCVELVAIEGLNVTVRGHDLLDGTPILDIKPYIPYADSFPEAAEGWLETCSSDKWNVTFADSAAEKLAWLNANGVTFLAPFIQVQVSENPTDAGRKRVKQLTDGTWEVACRTWRLTFKMETASRKLTILAIASGYTATELSQTDDRYHDKAVHRAFQQRF